MRFEGNSIRTLCARRNRGLRGGWRGRERVSPRPISHVRAIDMGKLPRRKQRKVERMTAGSTRKESEQKEAETRSHYGRNRARKKSQFLTFK